MRLATRLLPGLTCALAAVANADTFYVNGTCGNDAWTGLSQTCNAPNGPKRTIQAGIDTSVTGDTISVADGTYTGVGNKNLDFGGRLITLRSENGPAACIIDCEDDGRGFRFHNAETADAVLEGFTVRNGNVGVADGSAILCESASPTILNCVLEDNVSDRSGGGLFSSGGDPSISNCTISRNRARRSGGGIHLSDGSPTVTGCTIQVNVVMGALASGGGLYLSEGSATVTACTFDRNAVFGAGGGGGLYNESSGNLTITDCTLSGNNSGDGQGSGLRNKGNTTATGCIFIRNRFGGMVNAGSATVTNCTFRGNMGFIGGGMENRPGSNVTVTNCTFIGNFVDRWGGGMYNFDTSPTVSNCTFSANFASSGSGMFNRFGGSMPTVTNCIFWNDGSREIVDADGAEATVRFSDVRGGWRGLGNIDADPLFVRAPDPGPDGFWGTPDDDYGDLHLLPGSPCIDAADNTAVPPDITADFDGNPRFVDDPATPDCQWAPGTCGDPPIVDMGAYEFQGTCDACDMNCDGEVNAFDIEPFLGILFDGDEPCAPCTGDTNGDDNVDAFDIEPFLTCLFGP